MSWVRGKGEQRSRCCTWARQIGNKNNRKDTATKGGNKENVQYPIYANITRYFPTPTRVMYFLVSSELKACTPFVRISTVGLSLGQCYGMISGFSPPLNKVRNPMFWLGTVGTQYTEGRI